MSTYRIANNLREVQLIAAGVARGMRESFIASARSFPRLRHVYVRQAREVNHDLVQRLRAARRATP